MKKFQIAMVLLGSIFLGSCKQPVEKKIALEDKTWREGIVVDEFIYDKAPYLSAHAATIVENTDGELVASWFGGTHERNPDVCIYVSKRKNGKWTEAVEVANGVQNDTLRYPTWNPVLYQIPGGDLLLFYKIGPHPSTWWGMLKRSSDGGETWSEAEKLPEGFLGPIKNKPELLDNGNLLLPSSIEGDSGWHLRMESTSDFGKTWNMQDTLPKGPNDINAIQPSILFHDNGKLQQIGRTKNSHLFTTWSEDNGQTWSPLELLNMPNNNSGTDAVTMKNGEHALIYNHVWPNKDMFKSYRSPLNIATSKDGVNWDAALVLEDSKISQYSYPSIIQGSDGMLHCVYTWRRQKIKYVKIDPSQLVTFPIVDGVWPGPTKERYEVAVCDWMILKRQKLGEFERAKEIGADAVEMDMGGLGDRETFDSKFVNGDTASVRVWNEKMAETGVRISSIAMSGFYGQSFAERPTYKKMVTDCIEVMKTFDVQVAYLPLGTKCDLVKYPELRPAIVERLRWAGEQVDKINGIIAVETSLSAEEEKKLLEEVGNRNIKIAFNFANAIKNGRDISKELKTLGRDNIGEIHASNTDGHWIENDPAIDLPKIKETLDNMHWKGWLIVERSRDTTDVHNVVKNYGANVAYLKKVFQGE
ncbi:exo-alpha-sialidase [Aestuariibaculum lutulentum]|uniref:Exo-alpha-sialidase n=1 Tax=Aestuariibaculum lutulentum TaxID=2920935 RepID=A0ABS9RGL2_9FLAO|nr:exo-alpha-sialidase [Aestuariibaculum lutulentum]MCH4551651.1 exo-alpha-sialidase [Aestuariibaculum lutulentum]